MSAILPQSPLRSVKTAVVLFAVTVMVFWALTPTYVMPPIDHALLMLAIDVPVGADGREVALTDRDWEVLLSQMTSTAVIDAALADPRMPSISGKSGPADPRVELRRMFRLDIAMRSPEPNVVLLKVNSPVEPVMLAEVLASAIQARCSAGIRNIGRPTIMDARVPGTGRE